VHAAAYCMDHASSSRLGPRLVHEVPSGFAACASGICPGPPGGRFGYALLRLVSPYGWGRGA
jgi:hypothetical protein